MEEKETSRLEAFSDGVFGVAITLLVLNIKISGFDDTQPVASAGEFWGHINIALPMLAAYITSFSTIGIMWLNHHRLFQHIKRTDTGLMLINLLLLMIIVFIPVPTALVATNFSSAGQIPAGVLYSGTFFLMACCYNGLWRYASFRGRLLGKNVDMKAVKAIDRQYWFGPTFYIVGFGLAWLSLQVSVTFALILALFFALPSKTVLTRSEDEGPSIVAEDSAEDARLTDEDKAGRINRNRSSMR